MITNLDTQRVRLKPYYSIMDTGEKLFLMMAPCEVFELPRDTALLRLLRKMESTDGVNLDEMEHQDSSAEREMTEQVVKEMWARGSLMSLDGSEFLDDHHRNRLETWLPLIGRFTNKPYEVAARLKDCRIGVFTNNTILGVKIKRAIKNTRLISEVRVYEDDPSLDWRAKMDDMALCIVVSMGFHPGFFLKANRHALDCGTPMLPVILMPDGLSSIVGPLTVKDEGPCWNCFYRRYAGQGTNLEIYDLLAQSAPTDSDYRFVWSGPLLAQLVIPEIILALTNIDNPRTLGRVFFIDLLNFNAVEHPVLMLPRCESCGYAKPVREKPCVSPFAF